MQTVLSILITSMLLIIYSTAKETLKFVTLKLIKNKVCWMQEMHVTCKTNCIVMSHVKLTIY